MGSRAEAHHKTLSEAEDIRLRLSKCHSLLWIGDDKIRELALSSTLLEARRGRVIYSTEERHGYLYIVLSGCVTVRYGESQVIEAVLGPGDFLGLASLFGAARYKSFAVATLNSRLARLPAARFIETMLGVAPEKFIRTLSMTAGRYFRLVESYPIAAKSLKRRIVFALLNLAEKFGVPEARGTLLNLPLTHKFIADLVAASRPRVSVAMTELERGGGLLRAHQRFIVNVESLQSVLRQNPRRLAPGSARSIRRRKDKTQ